MPAIDRSAVGPENRSAVTPPELGLCGTCRHSRTIESRKGSRFYLCERSRTDPTFPRYPRLPVLACRGYQPRADG